MNKKNSPNWYIAATHFLTAGFVMPFLIKLVAVAIMVALFPSLSFGVAYFIQLAVIVLSVWLGVMYSAKYIYKKYVITNSGAIIFLSTIYAAILQAVLLTSIISKDGGINTDTVYSVISILVFVLLFYFFSKKYISNNTTDTTI